MTLFIIYFALPAVTLSLRFEALTAAAISLILWGSAQVAEATRGAVQSIPREQHEAAAALGFGWVGRHAFVIMPQALRRLLPPLVSLLVNIIQNTTIAQIIGVNEVLESGERSVERLTAPPPIGLGEIHSFEIYAAVMVIFFAHLVPAHAPRRVPREAPGLGTARPRLSFPDRGGGSSVGRAPGCGPGGRGFESRPPPLTARLNSLLTRGPCDWKASPRCRANV